MQATITITVSNGPISTTVTRTATVGPNYHDAEMQIEDVAGRMATTAVDDLRVAMKDRAKPQ